MAKHVVVTMVDDIDGSAAAESINFSVDGHDYEIDLSEKNAAKLRKALSPYTARARQLNSSSASRSRVTVPAVGQSRNALIRAWAASQGLTVPSRGRIPRSAVAAYDAQH